MSFFKALSELKAEVNSKYANIAEPSRQHKPTETQQKFRNLKLIEKIQRIIYEVLKSVEKGEAPVLRPGIQNDWNSCVFEDRCRITVDWERIKLRKVDFQRASSRSSFTTIIFLLSKIYKLLITQKTSTRRELYYKNLKIFRSQQQVDQGMKDVSLILNAPSWELKIFATSKGIMFGPVVLELTNGELLDCAKGGGVSVPSNALEVEKMSSTATWILIIEKDASFQNIIGNKLPPGLDSCIFITGKGFPDVSTRLMVCKLWEHLRIPILALVDADPHGFEIMCVYRFGSASLSSYSGHLACPVVRWLGVHPSDIKPLLLDSKNLSPRELRKIHLLLQRSHIAENKSFKTQLEILLSGKVKAEIEGVSNISPNYLTQAYLKNKIQFKDYY